MSEEAIRRKQAAAEEIYFQQLRAAEQAFRQNVLLKERERDRALNESYIGYRIAKRDLPAALSAAGMHGGLAETSAVRLRNTYEESRRGIREGFDSQYGELNRQYTGGREEIEAKITAAKIQAEAEILEENARRAAELAAAEREKEMLRYKAELDFEMRQREAAAAAQRSAARAASGGRGTAAAKNPASGKAAKPGGYTASDLARDYRTSGYKGVSAKVWSLYKTGALTRTVYQQYLRMIDELDGR